MKKNNIASDDLVRHVLANPPRGENASRSREELPLAAVSNHERPVNTKQLCEHLQISQRTLATMRAKGLVPYWKLSEKNYRYRISAVEMALANLR
jgi:hypothetical protein